MSTEPSPSPTHAILSSVSNDWGPPQSIGVNAATNRLTQGGYDANGNYLGGSTDWTYDIENRLTRATPTSGSGNPQDYGYDARNKRTWKRQTPGSAAVEQVFFYGIGGRLGTYEVQWQAVGGQQQMRLVLREQAYYFGHKLMRSRSDTSDPNGWLVSDRLGSMVLKDGIITKYRPYGQQYSGPTVLGQGFGTYYRDQDPGLDYADQRYYANVTGRFVTPDPSASASAGKPVTWNKYEYVSGDPVNKSDPSGLNERPSYCDFYPEDPLCYPFRYCPDGTLILSGGTCPSLGYAPPLGDDAWNRMSTDQKVSNTRDLVVRTASMLSDDCLNLLNNTGADGSNVDGRDPEKITPTSLANVLRGAQLHNLSTQGNRPMTALYVHLDAEVQAKAAEMFGNRTITEVLGSGFATEFYGNIIYYTTSTNFISTSAQGQVQELAATLIDEALHMFGRDHSTIPSIYDIEDKCIKPLGLTP